jgi:hypothetical protein
VKRALLAVVVTALAGLVAPAAHAAADSTYQGGCSYAAASRNVSFGSLDPPGVHTGVLASATVVHSPAPADNPVSAVVTCTVEVDGQTRATASFAGTVVVAGMQRISFPVAAGESVAWCETVDYTSDATPTTTVCTDAEPPVPQAVIDLVNNIIDLLNQTTGLWQLDPTICALLTTLAPTANSTGLADIRPDGDTWLFGGKVWDCPPYDDGPPYSMSVPTPPECSDGLDNDLDGRTDYPADPECWGPESDAEGLHLP